jgi:hypothetical protein
MFWEGSHPGVSDPSQVPGQRIESLVVDTPDIMHLYAWLYIS